MEEGVFGGFGVSGGFHEKTEGDISRRQESIKRGTIGNRLQIKVAVKREHKNITKLYGGSG